MLPALHPVTKTEPCVMMLNEDWFEVPKVDGQPVEKGRAEGTPVGGYSTIQPPKSCARFLHRGVEGLTAA